MSSSVGALSAANAGSWLGSVIGLRPPPCPYPPRAGERIRTIKVTREADEAPNPPPLPRSGGGRGGGVRACYPCRKWPSTPLSHVDEAAGDRGGRGHGRRNEMGAALEALTALEIAIRGRGAALAGREAIRVHRKAHGAAGLAPFKPRGDEDLVQSLGLGLRLDQSRPRHDHRRDARIHLLA